MCANGLAIHDAPPTAFKPKVKNYFYNREKLKVKPKDDSGVACSACLGHVMLSQQVKHFKLPKKNPLQSIFGSQAIATLIEPLSFL